MPSTVAARCLLFVALGVTAAAPHQADADSALQRVIASEKSVKRMPMSQRPNRIGHFYGNTVRRLEQGKLCVNCGKYERPVARYFYITK